MSRPPSGRKTKKSAQLLHKEQEFKDLNAALEEKTANLINEAESVLRGQNSIFNETPSAESFNESSISTSGYIPSHESTLDSVKNKTPHKQSKPTNNKFTKQRPVSVPSGQTRKKDSTKNLRTQSSKSNRQHEISSMNLIEERAALADQINTLELEAADELYTPSNMNEEVLPEAASDIGTEATIRFLKAKLRVMQEELENTLAVTREKSSKISALEKVIKEKEEAESHFVKKNEQLQNTIEKHKSQQEELRAKNTHLESEMSTLKKELESKKRETKQMSANKNTIDVRLNRALEEVEKYKSALQRSKESTQMVNNADRKKLEQLQNENKRLEKQKAELMTAFKKQLKLIEVLKRQKMHIEAAKLLELSEEEFVRALEWGK